MEVDIFIPCFIDQLYPETGMNMVRILEKLTVEVHYNSNQTCCGQMLYNTGAYDEARVVGEKFINDFNNNKRPIVSPSSSCVGFIRNAYPKLFHNTAKHNECKGLVGNVYEFTEFLVKVLKITNVGAEFNHKVTYHDSCSALRELKIKDTPRLLLSKVRGLTLIEMNRTDECCGFGGTFSVKNEAISVAMAQRKVQNAIDTGAEYIVSADASCLMHQQAYINKNNLPIKTIHIIDLLASGIR